VIAALFLFAQLAPVPAQAKPVVTTIAAGGGFGLLSSIAGDAKFDAMIGPLLPTYVEFDARFNAACSAGFCTDRASVLTVVSLRSTVSPEPPQIEK
jgi:hypothetical protein